MLVTAVTVCKVAATGRWPRASSACPAFPALSPAPPRVPLLFCVDSPCSSLQCWPWFCFEFLLGVVCPCNDTITGEVAISVQDGANSHSVSVGRPGFRVPVGALVVWGLYSPVGEKRLK